MAQRKAAAAKSKSVSAHGGEADGSHEQADPAAIKKPSVKDMIAAKRAAMKNKLVKMFTFIVKLIILGYLFKCFLN